MRARQIWLRGPSACWKASGGSRFSWVPHPISAVVVPSSWNPSTLHVLTNSSTAFGTLEELRVPLADVNDLDAKRTGEVVEASGLQVLPEGISPAFPFTLPSDSAASAMSMRPCLVKWLIESRVGSMLQHGSRARLRPARKPLRGASCDARSYNVLSVGGVAPLTA